MQVLQWGSCSWGSRKGLLQKGSSSRPALTAPSVGWEPTRVKVRGVVPSDGQCGDGGRAPAAPGTGRRAGLKRRSCVPTQDSRAALLRLHP